MQVQKIIADVLSEKEEDLSRLRALNSRQKSEISTLKRQLAEAKRRPATYVSAAASATTPTAPVNDRRASSKRTDPRRTRPDPNAKNPNSIDRSRHKEIASMSDAEWQRKCQPNRAGKYPCLDCLKKGMRYFHEVCDPVKREANFGRHKTRQKEGEGNCRVDLRRLRLMRNWFIYPCQNS